jgi:hypothetical protein
MVYDVSTVKNLGKIYIDLMKSSMLMAYPDQNQRSEE